MKTIKITKSILHGFKLDQIVEVNDHQASVIIAIGAGEVIHEEKQVENPKSTRGRRTTKQKAE